MRQLFRDPRFVYTELIFIIFCGAVWLVSPKLGIWFIPIAFVPFLFRLFMGQGKFNLHDLLVLVFLITAWIGYWAAYDQTTAWAKAWFIVTGVLLYYSLLIQPKENLVGVSVLLFCMGIGVSFYYFLTYDFISDPRRIEFVNRLGRWFMEIRPQTGWTPIHPNYVAGLAAITAPFIFYPILTNKNDGKNPSGGFYLFSFSGLGIASLAVIMATSRGVILAIGSGVGAWLLWRITRSGSIKHRLKSEAAFPILLLVYLCAIVAFLYAGPAQLGGVISDSNFYGTGSRAELIARSLYLVFDYPIIGGGLGSFPGLYSHYLLGIPFYYLPNSHNLFLDVAIEQGLLGGLSFFILYAISLSKVSWSISKEDGRQIFRQLALFSLIVAIVHGMVDDYLYNGAGSIFALFLVGLSLNDDQSDRPVQQKLDLLTAGVILTIWVAIALLNLNTIRSIWYANLGAVQMSQVELMNFPANEWIGKENMPSLEIAEGSLRSALQYDPVNPNANYRLGMISMLRQDFESAVGYLETAHVQMPNHRGMIKTLGYAYAWSGDMVRAQIFLAQIPEAQQELDVYTWWWGTQERDDLATKASLALENLNVPTP